MKTNHVHTTSALGPGLPAPDFTLHSTPKFFINGARHDGSFDFDTLLWVIKRQR